MWFACYNTMKSAFLTCVLFHFLSPGLYADYLQNYRVVVTFHRWEDASVGYNLTDATVVKQYGRRLVLSLSEPVNESTIDDETFELSQEIGLTLIESIELDSFVSVAGDPDMYALMDENASLSMNGVGSYIESQSLFQWNLADSEPFSIHAESIWKTTNSTPDVVVAVLDSGLAMVPAIEFLHWSPGYDFVSDPDISMDGDGRDSDSSDYGDVGPGCTGWGEPSWHGTKVANILAANHETMAIKGVAQNVTVMPVRVLGLCGSGYANDVADAIVWSAGGQINGISYNPTPSQIISLSIAGHGKCPGYLQSAVNQAIGLGSVIIAAAGNDGAASINNTFPANCVGVISVGASDRAGGLASYSNAGASVVAPGGDSKDGVYAITVEKATWKLKPVLVSGTSVSVPHIAGLAGLFWSNISENVNESKTAALLHLLSAVNISNNTSEIMDVPLSLNDSNHSGMVSMALDASSVPPTCDYFPGIGCGCNYDCTGGKCTPTASDSWGTHPPTGALDGLAVNVDSSMWHTATTGGNQWLRVEFPAVITVVGGVIRNSYSPGRVAYYKVWVGNDTSFLGVGNSLCYSSTVTTASYDRFSCGATGKFIYVGRQNINDYFEIDELNVYKSSYVINCTCPNKMYNNGLDCLNCPYGSYCNNLLISPCPIGLSSPAGAYDVSQCITTCSPSYYTSLLSLIPRITVTNEIKLINWARSCGVNKDTACTATSSSVWDSNWLPAKAFDGITGFTSATTYVENAFHPLTSGVDEYLRIDFGVIRNIEKGSIWNRVALCNGGTDCGGGRVKNFQVYVGNDGSGPTANNMCYQDSGTNITNPLYSYCQNFTCVASGRYAFIRNNQINYMNIGELELYGPLCYCPFADMTNTNGTCTCTSTECALKTAICGSGTYNTGADSTNVSAFNVSNCQACASGTYSSVLGSNSSATCTQCAMGSYSMGSGSSACIKCQAGTYSTKDFADSSGYCQGCPGGTYSVVTGSSSPLACISCVLGSYSLGSASSTCVLCQTGTYSTSSFANASSTCQACPGGTYSIVLGLNSSSSCISCPAGSYTVNLGSTLCLYCQAGTFSTNINATAASTCQACQSGFHSSAIGASSSSACTACAVGSYGQGVTLSSCINCVAGTYSTSLYAELVANCKACQIGTYSAVVAATSNATCVICANGAYSASAALSVCVSCPTGTYSLTVGASLASSCISCVAGTYSATVGASSSGVCLNCTTGSYNLGAALSTCVQCVTGTYSTSVASAALANCLACVAGTYSATVGASSSGVCLNCTTGSYNLGAGLSTCVQCVAGTYSITVASTALANCLACAGGFYSVALGASSNATCLSCAVGSYTLGTASTLCTKCNPSTYSITANAVTSSNCLYCSNGTYSTGYGYSSSASCIQCAVGTYMISASSGAQTSNLCASEGGTCNCNGLVKFGAGTAWSGLVSVSGSIACSNGVFGDPAPGVSKTCYCIGFGTCTLCPAGTYQSTVGQSGCNNCPYGTYQSGIQQSGCNLCALGSYNQGVGSSLCLQCQAGKYSVTVNASASSACQNCSVGTYSSVVGSTSPTTCTNCPTGTFSTGIGVTMCTNSSSNVDVMHYCGVTKDQLCTWTILANVLYSSGAYGIEYLFNGDLCKGLIFDNTGVAPKFRIDLGTQYSSLQITFRPGQQSGCTWPTSGYCCPTRSNDMKFYLGNDTTTSVLCYNSGNLNNGISDAVFIATLYSASTCSNIPARYITVEGHTGDYFTLNKMYIMSPVCLNPAGCNIITCVAGTYQTASGVITSDTFKASNCQGCSSGTYSTVVGANSSSTCIMCQPGTYSNGTGATACVTCDWGYYSTNNASATCTRCQSGLVTTAAGSTSADACAPCSVGTIPGTYARSAISPPSGASNNPVPGVANTYYLLFPYTTDNSGGTGQTTYSLTIPSGGGDYTTDILLVAGGGGGGNSMGGGGGGGGVIYKQGAILTAGTTYSIKVGNGGINGVSAQGGASDGKSTVAFGGTVFGGGGGGHEYYNLDPGNNGGCGGGGSTNEGGTSLGGSVVVGIPGASVLSGATVFGGVGGIGYYSNGCGGGGGGGGAGTPGIGSICAKAGDGGDGTLITITGQSLYWAGGGGGGAWGANAGNGGLGGGGGGVWGNKVGGLMGTSGGGGLNPAGTPIDSKAGNGGASTGSGGGGTRYNGNSASIGGSGGSGVVIVRYTTAAIMSMCTPCPVGTFSSINTSTCSMCQAGTYSNVTSASTCLVCPPGTYGNGSGATACIACNLGYYSSNNASTTCTQCQSGLVTTSAGSTSCTPCQPGTYGTNETTNCTTCNVGYYSSNNASTTCTKCQSGLVVTTGSTSCAPCPSGSFIVNSFRSAISPPSGASSNPVTGVVGTYYLLFPYTTDNSGGTGQTTYSLTIPNSGIDYTADILLVAGGGGGGNSMGGGGGGGGVLYKQGAILTAGTTYSIKVGNGGINGVAAQDGLSDGRRTTAFGGTVFGGGGGGHEYSAVEPGNNGGSGGGGCGSSGNAIAAGGTVVSAITGVSVLSGATVYGQNGGVGYYPSFGGGGGGGGAGTAGKGTISGKCGDGGNGTLIAITGQLLYWAGGGGGGGWYADAGSGGLGGGGGGTAGYGVNGIGGGSALNPGGTPATSDSNAGSGGASTGGGGGGARWVSSLATSGGQGGSGVVIVRYTTETWSVCTPCPIGTFSSFNASTCTACQAGTYSNVTSASTCLSCPTGKYGNGTAATACISCFYGFYSDSYGSSICTSCQTGQYTVNMDSNSSGMCLSCGPGTILSTGGSVSASGGVLSTDQSSYNVYTFKTVGSSQTITVDQDTYIDVLVVGGGGSGCCGGGGGGQVVAMSNVLFSTGVYTVTVGSGGASCGTSAVGVNGGTSSIVKSSFTIQALGGGGGVRISGGTYSVSVANGGGVGYDTNGVYPTAMSSMVTGFVGGIGDRTSYGSSGGGGGAGAVGGNPFLDPAVPTRSPGSGILQCGGYGGIGVANSFQTGSPQYYGGGGGGGINTALDSCSVVSNGGNGGGGNGAVSNNGQGTSGLLNTGGGGGGVEAAMSNSMIGGSGIVVIRYFTRPYCISCDSGKFKGINDLVCAVCQSGSYTPNTSSCVTCPPNSYCAGGSSIVKCPYLSVSEMNSRSISNCSCPSAVSNTRLSSLLSLTVSTELNMINWARSCGIDYSSPCTPTASSVWNGQPWIPYINDGQIGGSFQSHGTSNAEYVRIDFGIIRKVEKGVMWNRRDCCYNRGAGFQIYIGNDGTAPTSAGNTMCFTDTGTNVSNPVYGYSQNFTCSASGRYAFAKSGASDFFSFSELEFFGYPCLCPFTNTSVVNDTCVCPSGTITDSQLGCKKPDIVIITQVCPLGNIVLDSICTPCPVGYYAPNTSVTTCVACSIGKYNAALGQTVCVGCSPGYGSLASSANCTACDVGYYSLGNSSCISCPSGSYGTTTGATTCSSCPSCDESLYRVNCAGASSGVCVACSLVY